MRQRLTDEQERIRIEGLRTLARIIVRHALANPDLYQDGSASKSRTPATQDPVDGGNQEMETANGQEPGHSKER